MPDNLLATDTQRTEAVVSFGGESFVVVIEATREVPQAHVDILKQNLMVVEFDATKHKALHEFLAQPGPLQNGKPEVRMPVVKRAGHSSLIVIPPDGWEIVRPQVFRLKSSYTAGWVGAVQGPLAADVGLDTDPLKGEWESITGRLTCKPTKHEGAQPLPFAQVEIEGTTVHTDSNGSFTITPGVSELTRIRVIYEGDVSAGAASASMIVMNDWHKPRYEYVDTSSGRTGGDTLHLGSLELTSLDCELFRLGAIALHEYLQIMEAPPPAETVRIKRWWGVNSGTPYAYYDYTVIAKNFLEKYPSRQARRSTVFHEFGHTIRHAADGDAAHWAWDNFRWAYARFHDGTEVFNEQYAVNEGWAQYWECTDSKALPVCPLLHSGIPAAGFLDWNEMRIGARLVDMSNAISTSRLIIATGTDPAAMVKLLIDNPGSIHSLWDFEKAYCKAVALPNTYCDSDAQPKRIKRECPPGFSDDGATCRLPNVKGKPSYGRGVGVVPTACGANEESDAGLCYADCPSGYDGVGPVCWKRCSSGYNDDGAFCRRDAKIISSSHGSCPWYDVCGLTFAAGCSTCPESYKNDGCTCRRNAHIYTKKTKTRGVGSIPDDCSANKEYDAGLCYPLCSEGYNGIGPVCWGSCPKDWADHGATCYRPPKIIVKY